MENNKVYLSHSASQSWKTCPELYYLKHRMRVECLEVGASLAFGIAIDIAIGYLLNMKKDGKQHIGDLSFKNIFTDDKDKGWNLSFDSDILRYRSADYDHNVIFEKVDLDVITTWETELKVTATDAIKYERQKDHRTLKDNEFKMFNRLCWLSLRNKGILMLEAFYRDIYPKITKVIAVQHKLDGEIEGVAKVGGYIDLICEFDGKDLNGNKIDKPVILDIKTSSSYYKDQSVMFSEQLLLYLSAVGNELKTNNVGFLVLLKFMDSEEFCVKCGSKRDSRHRTCNQMIGEERCNGAWKVKPKGKVQILIDPITKERQQDFIDSFANLAVIMGTGRRFKNYNACFNYGLCPYFHLCHYKDQSKYNFPKDNAGDWEEDNRPLGEGE